MGVGIDAFTPQFWGKCWLLDRTSGKKKKTATKLLPFFMLD